MKVGIIGLGRMGRNHLRVLRDLEGVEVVGYVDPLNHVDSAILPNLKDLEGLLKSKPDYCVVASPSSTHVYYAIECMNFRVPVIVEKPLAHNLVSAQKIFDGYLQSGTVAAVGHVERFNPAVVEARKILHQGIIGELTHLKTRRLSSKPLHVKDVGVILDLATHDIDLSLWLTNSNYVNVAAERIENKEGVDEIASIVGRTKSGVLLEHSVSWRSPIKDRGLELFGTKGMISVDTLSMTLKITESQGSDILFEPVSLVQGEKSVRQEMPAIKKEEPLKLQHSSFQDFIAGKPSEVATIGQALEVMRVAQECLEL